MKIILDFCCTLCLVLCATASEGTSLDTPGGKTLSDVRLREIQGDTAIVWHSGGIEKVPLSLIPDDVRKDLGIPTTSEIQQQSLEQASRDKEEALKGLVRYGNEYITPEDKAQRVLDENAISTVMAKSERNVAYQVFQVLKQRLILCARAVATPSGDIYYVGNTFALVGIDTFTIAEGDRYRHDIYWCGTYSYMNLIGSEVTVPVYVTDYNEAVRQVRKDLEARETASEKVAGTSGASNIPSRKVSGGTGFAITSEGHILTSFHVVENAKKVEVKIGARLLPAEVIASDPDWDLAIMKVAESTQPVEFSPKEVEKLGAECFVVGFPNIDYQGTDPKVTKGVISSLGGSPDTKNLYQIDAAVQPGNSGGPVLDRAGNIVGVTVAVLDQLRVLAETGTIPQNVNYCIKRQAVMSFLDAHPEIRNKIKIGVSREISTEDALELAISATCLVIARS